MLLDAVVDAFSPHSCWFDISRRDADRLLLMPGNARGTYLIRPSSGTLKLEATASAHTFNRSALAFASIY